MSSYSLAHFRTLVFKGKVPIDCFAFCFASVLRNLPTPLTARAHQWNSVWTTLGSIVSVWGKYWSWPGINNFRINVSANIFQQLSFSAWSICHPSFPNRKNRLITIIGGLRTLLTRLIAPASDNLKHIRRQFEHNNSTYAATWNRARQTSVPLQKLGGVREKGRWVEHLLHPSASALFPFFDFCGGFFRFIAARSESKEPH